MVPPLVVCNDHSAEKTVLLDPIASGKHAKECLCCINQEERIVVLMHSLVPFRHQLQHGDHHKSLNSFKDISPETFG